MATPRDLDVSGRHAWQRWEGLWHVVFAVTLVAGLVVALPDETRTAPGAVVVALAAALATSYAWWNVVRPPMTERGRAFVHLWLWVLWLALIGVHPGFVMVGAFLAAHVCYLSLRYAIPVAALFIAGVLLRAATDGGTTWPDLVMPLVIGAGVGVLLAAYIAAIARESAARADLIVQLDDARGEVARVEHERGVLEERQRLARDVHDTLAQRFTSIIVQLRAADASADLQRRDTHLDRAMTAAQQGLDESRRIVWDLDDGTPPLEASLEQLMAADPLGGPFDLRHVVAGAPIELPAEVRRELLLIAREAVTNAAHHAGAGQAIVTVSYLDDAIALDVRDDGCGFDLSAANGGYGLRSMRDRAERLGGTLSVESAPGAGTSIAVLVPLA